MDIARLIDALRRPETYPHPVEDVEILQTHISVVALAGPYAYKVKKPLNLGFLDFRTPEARLHFCREEVRLNRRLAPDVYLGVVPLAETAEGLRLDGAGPAVEHAVKMVRLPEAATLRERLRRGELGPEVLMRLGRRVAEFHRTAEGGPEVDRCGRLDVVAANARDNLLHSRRTVGTCVSEAVFERLSRRLEDRLRELGPLIEARADEHRPRDTHGDLHLDHVYLFPERDPPRDLVIIDCIEFTERYRYEDPVADMAFLVMDLIFHGRPDLVAPFADAYFEVADDSGGRGLLQFYVAYRAAVRAKVRGITAGEPEVPAEARAEALRRARAYWLLALSELEDEGERPCLVLVGGLPGTGKSTLTRGLEREAGFEVISSDRVRKELAGLAPEESAAAGFGEGIYTREWDDRTYATCLERAGALIFEGRRVVVDASFREAGRRQAFLDAARGWGVRACLLVCTAPTDEVRARLAARSGDVSDADWAIHVAAAEAWEVEDRDPRQAARTFHVPTDDGSDTALGIAGAVPSRGLDQRETLIQ